MRLLGRRLRGARSLYSIPAVRRTPPVAPLPPVPPADAQEAAVALDGAHDDDDGR
jgi:hypothetical protein